MKAASILAGLAALGTFVAASIPAPEPEPAEPVAVVAQEPPAVVVRIVAGGTWMLEAPSVEDRVIVAFPTLTLHQPKDFPLRGLPNEIRRWTDGKLYAHMQQETGRVSMTYSPTANYRWVWVP